MQLEPLRPHWPALNRLLDEALQLAPAERPGWLALLGGEDATLRPTLARLLEVQLEIETGDFLRASPALPEPGLRAGDEAGDLVGPWRLLRRLGHGGMGSVWLAERADGGLKRPVALKLPRLAWDEGIAARMARERDILAALDHPHIARLHDAGFDAQGRPWLALEYVEGRSIDRHCSEQGLDTAARVALLLQAASAVAYAHARQVVHRDLKPSNILVGHDGRVRLLDFGIARLLHGSGETALTQVGERVLTIAYASPEQVRGEAVGPASDVYSLGVVAYELLAGTRLYRLQRGSAAELEEAITAGDTVPPSRAATDAATARALRGNLDAIVCRALERDARLRTPGADMLAADLAHHLAGEPVSARAERTHERLVRWLRRRRVPLLLAGAVLLLLGAALGFGPVALAGGALAVGLVAASLQARQARRQAAEAERQARRADAAQQFLTGLLDSAGIGAGDAASRSELTVGAWLEEAAHALRTQPAADPAVHESLLQLVSRLQHGLGGYATAALLRGELVQRLATRGAPALEQARAGRAWGETLAAAERFDEAAAALEAALAAVPGDAIAERGLLQAQLGLVRLRQGGADVATALIESSAAAADASADALGALAQLRGEQGRLEEAYALFDAAIAADSAAGDTLRPAALARRYQLAELLTARVQYSRAESTYSAALRAIEQAGGADHPATVRLRESLCHLLTLVGRPAEAAQHLRQAVATVEARPSAFPALMRPRLQLMQAQLLLEEGRIEEGGPVVMAATEPLCALADEEGSFAMVMRARWLADTGQFDEALRWLDEVLRRRVAAFGARHAYVLATLNRIAVALMAAARFDEAEARLREVLGTAPEATAGEPVFGSPWDMAATTLVHLDLERGRFAQAVEPALRALARLQALPAGQRTALNEITLRLRCARALLGCGRGAEAWPYLEPLQALAAPLYEHAPLRVAIDSAWAEAHLAAGDRAAARTRLDQAFGHLAAQPSLGPQVRRYPEHVARLLAAA